VVSKNISQQNHSNLASWTIVVQWSLLPGYHQALQMPAPELVCESVDGKLKWSVEKSDSSNNRIQWTQLLARVYKIKGYVT